MSIRLVVATKVLLFLALTSGISPAIATGRGLIDKSAVPIAGARGTSTASQESQGPVVLDFEGILDQEPISEFYRGGFGGNGSGPGVNFGIGFSSNSLALIDSDAGGSGDFGGEPSSSTILFFAAGSSAFVNVDRGFSQTVSFYYSAIDEPGSVGIYEGASGSGTLLKTVELPITPSNGAPDPTGVYSPFVPVTIEFNGVGRSMVFLGGADRIAIDNLALVVGSPLGNAVSVPSGSPFLLTLLGLTLISFATFKLKGQLYR